jgi:outer membrane protein TolC
MQISLFDLLLARQDEISAEINYVEALSDYWNAHSALRAAVGGKLPDALSVSTSQPTTMTAPPAESSHDHHH